MSSDALLQRVKKIRISDTVVDQIIALIEEGKLKVGDQLPGERELVNQLQVGRASVREALRILEAQGMIEVQPGKGTFVTGEITGLSVTESIKQWFREHSDEIRNVIELRDALERRAAFLGATRATEAQIAEMRAILDAAERQIADGDLEGLGHLDQRFHSLLGQCSGNVLMSQLIDGIIEAMGSPRRSILRIPGRAPQSLAEHRAIFQAIAAGDAEAAEQAVVVHINSVRKAIASLNNNSDDEVDP